MLSKKSKTDVEARRSPKLARYGKSAAAVRGDDSRLQFSISKRLRLLDVYFFPQYLASHQNLFHKPNFDFGIALTRLDSMSQNLSFRSKIDF